jgi:hypothetical protein
MLAGSIHPSFRLNFLSSNNERASHLLLHHRVLHQDKRIRTSTLRAITTCHSREKEKKRKELAKLINDKISNQEEMKESGKQEDDDPCI